jgi:hypothetical protein
MRGNPNWKVIKEETDGYKREMNPSALLPNLPGRLTASILLPHVN